MAVANGVASNRNVTITTKFKERQSGRTSNFFTYPYVTYSKSNGLVNTSQIENYVLYERPPKANEFGLGDAFNKNGNILVVGARLDTSGKLIPLKENETFYLKQDQTLSSLGSNSGAYVFSDSVRQELNNKGPGGLYQQSINGFKTVFQKDSGLSPQQVSGIYGGVLGTGAATPGIPSLDTDGTPPPSATPPAEPASSDNTDTADSLTEEQKLELSNFDIKGEIDNSSLDFGTLKYPEKIGTNGQDYILFEILEILPRKFKPNSPILDNKQFSEKVKGRIYLGIQPRITDTNSVNWTSDSMNAYEMVGQGSLMKFFKNTKSQADVEKIIEEGLGVVNNDGTVNAATSGFAAAAVGSNNNLFSRLSGAIINPNVELLFQAPLLRDFPFSFSMTPRNEKEEAPNVRKIIRAFKQASAVQVGQKYLFLKSPFVFRITYKTPDKQDPNVYKTHESLNRIKVCALTSMSVDYTPAGTYMTYDDEKRTMTSYNVQMSFTELEPVYDVDYATDDLKNNLDVIGY